MTHSPLLICGVFQGYLTNFIKLNQIAFIFRAELFAFFPEYAHTYSKYVAKLIEGGIIMNQNQKKSSQIQNILSL